MPQRKVILATGETYHIFNRSLRQTPLFHNKREFNLFLLTLKYYLQLNPPVKFSIYRQLKSQYKIDLNITLVKVVAYCIMPDHFHMILEQLKENGIRIFIHRLCSSYASYIKKKYKLKGPIFEGKFKAVRVGTDEQLLHLSRYIHLNPVTSYLVEDPLEYPFSSYKIYLGREISSFVDPSDVLANKDIVKSNYQKFVSDQKDYQRELSRIRHLVLDQY